MLLLPATALLLPPPTPTPPDRIHIAGADQSCVCEAEELSFLLRVPHIITAIIAVLTMIFNVRRIANYLLPSLLFYFSTTIPTVVQAVICALRYGGVEIEDYNVLVSSSFRRRNNGDDVVVG